MASPTTTNVPWSKTLVLVASPKTTNVPWDAMQPRVFACSIGWAYLGWACRIRLPLSNFVVANAIKVIHRPFWVMMLKSSPFRWWVTIFLEGLLIFLRELVLWSIGLWLINSQGIMIPHTTNVESTNHSIRTWEDRAPQKIEHLRILSMAKNSNLPLKFGSILYRFDLPIQSLLIWSSKFIDSTELLANWLLSCKLVKSTSLNSMKIQKILGTIGLD